MNQEWLCDNWKDYATTKLLKEIIDFACLEIMAISTNGVWKNLCLQFFSFHGIEKVDEESEEVFSKKMKLDLQEGNFTELLAVQHEALTSEYLMGLKAQRKNEERQRKGK